MSDTTTNLALPYIVPSQAQKHVTHNESLRMLDAQIHISVEEANLSTPPGSPVEGERHIVGSSPSGEWVGRETQLVAWQDGAWAFFAPLSGWLAYVADTDTLLVFDGSNWTSVTTQTDNLGGLGVNTASDAYNKVSVKSDSVLISHDDVTPGSGDARMTLNKAASGNSSVLQLQTGYAGKAELGLIGNDAFAIRYNLPVLGWQSLVHFDDTNANAQFLGNLVINTQGQSGTAATVQTITTNGRANLQFYNASNGEYWELAAELASGKALKIITSDGTTSSVPVSIEQSAPTDSIYLDSAGNLGIGTTPGNVKLDIDGPVRPGTYTVAGLPDPATTGAGAVIFVSDETGGAVLAFSDGTDWRRTTDRSVVS